MSTGERVCQGCGSVLQSEHPDQPGYVPAHVLDRAGTEPIRCRRCFRLEHYGVQHAEQPTQKAVKELPHDAMLAIREGVRQADLVLMVVDLWDFEGSFVPDLVAGRSAPLIVAANKVDLLPALMPASEVLAWVRDRFAARKIRPDEIRLVSAEKGTGVKALKELLQSRLPHGGKAAIVGVTNVGKSALIRRLLPRGSAGPTASTLPGTTQNLVEHALGGGVVLVDTPGYIPGHRVADNLCPQCAAQLIPRKRLGSRLVELEPGKAIVFGGLAAVKRSDGAGGAVVTLAYSSERIPIHHTRASRVLELLQDPGAPWLHARCSTCGRRLTAGGWEDVRFTVAEGEDLVIPSLGWISPRNAPLDVTVTVPAGSLVLRRPRLIGPKAARGRREKVRVTR